jgi:hypothetical protein
MIQKMALGFGIFFILVGICGFIPAFVFNSLLFGAFSDTMLHSVAYLVFGVLALVAAWQEGMYPLYYFKVFGIVFAVATVLGFIQGDTILGVASVTTADNILDLIIAAVTLWAGFGAKPEVAA